MLTESEVRELLHEARQRFDAKELSEMGVHFYEGLISAYDNVLNAGASTKEAEEE